MESNLLSSFRRKHLLHEDAKMPKTTFWRFLFRCMKHHFRKDLFCWITVIHWRPRSPFWGHDWVDHQYLTFLKNCVAYLRFFEIFAWNFFGTKCYIRFNMFNFAVSAATSSTFNYKRNSKTTLSLDETMQKARKNLASQFAQSNVKFCKR